MKKPNPRKHPLTQADVNRAEAKIRAECIKSCWAIFLTVLYDKEHADTEILQRVWGEINDLSESISKKYVKVNDLVNILKKEYEVELKK